MVEAPETEPRSEAQEAIMEATYRALSEHGYADLTVRDIAEEYGKTTAAVHYHYDTKKELLASFLDFLLDRLSDRMHEVETVDPEERLHALLDRFLPPAGETRGFLAAMVELRTQAAHDDRIRARFERNDEYIRYFLRTTVADGIEQGVFDDADPEHVAHACLTVVDGARSRYVTLGEEDAIDEARRTLSEYLDCQLGV